jgi:DNA-binding transcriptional ArsR family regulator
LRALAHPVRLAALSYLQRNGPATATQLSEHVGASPSVTSWHLRHLSTFGLVSDGPPPDGGTDRRQRWWRAVASGFRFEMPDTPDGREAGRLLRAEMLTQAINAAHQWLSEVEPELDAAWSGHALQAAAINDQMRSRVSGAFSSINYGVRPLGAVISGLLGTWLGVRETLLISSTGGLLAVLWLVRSPIIQVRDLSGLEPPD